MLCVVIMSVTFFTIILAAIMLSVILLSVITLNVVILNVVVPKNTKSCNSTAADDACHGTLQPGACTTWLFMVVIHSIP